VAPGRSSAAVRALSAFLISALKQEDAGSAIDPDPAPVDRESGR
jgi:hypothetical protein